MEAWRSLNTIIPTKACTGRPAAPADCLLSAPCAPLALWCLSLIKRKCDDELSAVRADLIYIRSPHLFPLNSPATLAAKKKKRKKTNNWKWDSREGPKGREWQQQALHFEIRHIQSRWELEQDPPRPCLSVSIERLELCCSDESKFASLMHFAPGLEWPLFLTLHVAFTEPTTKRSVWAPHGVDSAVFCWIGWRESAKKRCKFLLLYL